MQTYSEAYVTCRGLLFFGLQFIYRVAQHLVLREIMGNSLLHLPDLTRPERVV